MDLQLAGKRALVTGSSSGIGAGIARMLAAEGCEVVAPRSQGCCGALALHAGREPDARLFARRAIEVFEGARALRVARAIETGVISINSNSSVRVSTPFGGFKQSGVGRELGPDALEHYTELKNVYYATAEG